MIPYGRQDITKKDIAEVEAVLRSDYLTQGPTVPEFEKKISKITGGKYTTAVNSATSALHIACKALELGKNDILWTVPNSFVASANCGLYCDAKVDFIDIDPNTYNISIAALKIKLQLAERIGELPKIIIPVHFSGNPSDLLEINILSKQYGFKVIEDASHAIGSKYKGEFTGSCKFSDITVFSFHPVKIITSGEGGAATTNDPELNQKMKLLRSHGITRDSKLMSYDIDGPWYYEQLDLGWNYRMTDIHAALGISQIMRLEDYVERRNAIADYYDANLQIDKLGLPLRTKCRRSACHLYVLQVAQDLRLSFYEYLRENQIGVNVHYKPIHLQPYFRRLGFMEGDFPISENYYKQAISLPIFPSLSNLDQDFIIEKVIKFFHV